MFEEPQSNFSLNTSKEAPLFSKLWNGMLYIQDILPDDSAPKFCEERSWQFLVDHHDNAKKVLPLYYPLEVLKPYKQKKSCKVYLEKGENYHKFLAIIQNVKQTKLDFNSLRDEYATTKQWRSYLHIITRDCLALGILTQAISTDQLMDLSKELLVKSTHQKLTMFHKMVNYGYFIPVINNQPISLQRFNKEIRQNIAYRKFEITFQPTELFVQLSDSLLQRDCARAELWNFLFDYPEVCRKVFTTSSTL
jgi:hypothetical protein